MDAEHSSFSISSTDLSCPEDYVVEGRNLLREGDSIAYSTVQHGATATNFIFFGPYLTLSPGVYLFQFHGQLDGQLRVDFADERGTVVLKTLTINNFFDPVCLVVTKTVSKFEVRGFKTPALGALKLDSILVEAINFPLTL